MSHPRGQGVPVFGPVSTGHIFSSTRCGGLILMFFPVFWGSRTTRRLQRLPSSSASHVVRARDIGRCTEQQCALGLPLAISSSGSASGRLFRQWRCVVRVLCEMNLVAILPCGTWRHNTTPARHPLGVDLHASRLGFPPSKSLCCPPPDPTPAHPALRPRPMK